MSGFITKRLDLGSEDSTVSFKDCGLKLDTPSDAERVVSEIQACENLCTLCLSGNTIGVEAARAIAGALKQKPTLKRALWSDLFTGRLRSEIPLALEALGEAVSSSGAVLEELDLSDNAFGPDGVRACTSLLTSDAGRSIEVLKFHNNGLSSEGGEILAKALESSRSATSPDRAALKVIVCGRNRLENEGATALAETFEKLGTLEEVSLYQNGINASGISALAKSFSTNTTLRYLDLNDNTFTAEGGKAMAAVLPKLSVLEFINFDDCLIRDVGFGAIAEALEEHCGRVREIHFAFNEATLTAGIRMLRALAKKPSLNYINLNGNEFGETGVTEMSVLAETLDCVDALQSMSDDEGGDEDEDEDDDASTAELQEYDSSGIVTSPDSSKASLSIVSDSSLCKSPAKSADDDLSQQIAGISLAQE